MRLPVISIKLISSGSAVVAYQFGGLVTGWKDRLVTLAEILVPIVANISLFIEEIEFAQFSQLTILYVVLKKE